MKNKKSATKKRPLPPVPTVDFRDATLKALRDSASKGNAEAIEMFAGLLAATRISRKASEAWRPRSRRNGS